jgi:hypothetical protein
MSPVDIVEQARCCGVRLTLNAVGTGLSLSADSEPPGEIVALVKAHKPDLVAHLQAERGRMNHWTAARLIDWPPSHCLGCRKPIIVGQTWTAVANGEAAARFHQSCHGEWLEQQEFAARRALGLI